MNPGSMGRVGFGLVGLIGGYCLWLAVLCLIIAITPLHGWVIVAAAVFAILTAASFIIGRRNKENSKAIAYWLAPVLPAIASAYILLLVLF